MAATLDRFPGSSGTARETKCKSVYLWSKKRSELAQLYGQVGTREQRRDRESGMATTLPRDAEYELLKWINCCGAEGAPVSAHMLQWKALLVARDVGASSTYSASWCWRQGFLRRHKLAFRSRTRQGQISPDDAAARATRFAAEIQQRVAELDVDVVFNADQTPVYFKHIPAKTVAGKGIQTVWVRSAGKSKERITCVLLGDSRGAKYEPFLVAKCVTSTKTTMAQENKRKRHGFGRRLWGMIEALQVRHGVQIYGNTNAWWDSNVSVCFLEHHFGSRRGRELPPVLLLCDDFSAHWTSTVLARAKELNVELMRVPAGYTSVCQPADIAWNAPLKQRLRVCWVEMLHEQLDTHSDGDIAFRLTPPKRDKVMQWLSEAWSDLAASTIAVGFSPILAASALSIVEEECIDALAGRLERTHISDNIVAIATSKQDVVDQLLEIAV